MRLINFVRSRLTTWDVQRLLSPFWRLYCNLDDGAVITTERLRLPMHARHVYLVPAWVTWSGVSVPGVRHIYAFFDLPGMTCSLSRAAFPSPMQIYPRPRAGRERGAIDLTGDQFRALGETITGGISADPFLVCWAKGLVYLAMRESIRACRSGCTRALLLQPGTGTHPLVRVLNLIDTNLHEELPNDVLAETVPCSRAHLVRLFRALLGVAPARYITERRVSRATELLVYSDESLEQIAQACGFPNRHYFTRVFTQVIGTPPARYRKMTLTASWTR